MKSLLLAAVLLMSCVAVPKVRAAAFTSPVTGSGGGGLSITGNVGVVSPLRFVPGTTNIELPLAVASLNTNLPFTNYSKGLKLYGTSLATLDSARQYPAYKKAVREQKPIHILGMGDSTAHLTPLWAYYWLSNYYGASGFSMLGGNDWSYKITGTVEIKTYDTNWPAGYFVGTNGAELVFTNAYETFGAGGIVQADRAEIYYQKNTNSGGFNVSIRTNLSSSWTILQSVQSKSYFTVGEVVSVPVPNGYYQLKVSFTNLQATIFGGGLFQTNHPGIRWSIIGGPGAPYNELADMSVETVRPILQWLAPTLFSYESTGDSVANGSNSIAQFMINIGNTLTNSDMTFLLTPQINTTAYPGVNVDANNASVRAGVAQFPQLNLLDQDIIAGTYSNMLHWGMAGDGLHRTNLLDQLFAEEYLRQIGASSGFRGTAMDLIARDVRVPGLWQFGQRTTIENGGLRIWDELPANGSNVRLNIRMYDAQALFNIFQVGVSDNTYVRFDMANGAVFLDPQIKFGVAASPIWNSWLSNVTLIGTWTAAANAGSGKVWTSDGSGVGTWQAPTGGGGTNSPNINLLGQGTNVAAVAGVDSAWLIETNGNVIVNIAVAPVSGQTVEVTVSNRNSTPISGTLYTNSQAASYRDVGSKTNSTSFTIPAGGEVVSVFEWMGSYYRRTVKGEPFGTLIAGYKTELLTNSAGVITSQTTQRYTNYADANITVNASTDVTASFTNAVAGNRTITLSTPVIGTSGTLGLVSDGSARTLAILAPVQITWLSTNDTATATNILTTASKRSLFCWRVSMGTDGVSTNIGMWVKNQTP